MVFMWLYLKSVIISKRNEILPLSAGPLSSWGPNEAWATEMVEEYTEFNTYGHTQGGKKVSEWMNEWESKLQHEASLCQCVFFFRSGRMGKAEKNTIISVIHVNYRVTQSNSTKNPMKRILIYPSYHLSHLQSWFWPDACFLDPFSDSWISTKENAWTLWKNNNATHTKRVQLWCHQIPAHCQWNCACG